MNRIARFAPLAAVVATLFACSAEGVEGEEEAVEQGSSEEALTPCTRAIPDRTAERLADMPFQSLDRAALPSDIAGQAWGYPTNGRSVPNNFGAGRSYNEGHEGADIGGSTGDAILAAGAGTVVYTLTSCPNDNAGRNRVCGNGWGKHVVIRHEGNVYTRYAHLSAVAVKAGDTARAAHREPGQLGPQRRSAPALRARQARAGVRRVRCAPELRQGLRPREAPLRPRGPLSPWMQGRHFVCQRAIRAERHDRQGAELRRFGAGDARRGRVVRRLVPPWWQRLGHGRRPGVRAHLAALV